MAGTKKPLTSEILDKGFDHMYDCDRPYVVFYGCPFRMRSQIQCPNAV
jgi:hypothetical protein